MRDKSDFFFDLSVFKLEEKTFRWMEPDCEYGQGYARCEAKHSQLHHQKLEKEIFQKLKKKI